MKANKFMTAALFMGALAMGFASCEKPNTGGNEDKPIVDVTPDESTDPEVADLTVKEGYFTIAFLPAKGTVCNDIYFLGNYEASNWTLDAEGNVKFEKLDKFEGWYVAYVPTTLVEGETALQGKPIQAKADGTLSWDFQTGDAESWEVVEGDVTIEAGYAGEANLTYNDLTKPVIFKSKSWKNGNSPCVEVAEHDYVITAKLPVACEDTIVPAVIGDFNGWAVGVAMTKNDDGTYKATIHDAEGHGFKIKHGANGDWNTEIKVLKEDGTWAGYDNIVLGTEVNVAVDLSGENYSWSICIPAE